MAKESFGHCTLAFEIIKKKHGPKAMFAVVKPPQALSPSSSRSPCNRTGTWHQ